MDMKLVPIKTGGYYEQVMIYFKNVASKDYYPTAIVHIDSFWMGKGMPENEVYELLYKGEAVQIEFKMNIKGSYQE